MVATRSKTASLPAKRATYAEEQAIASVPKRFSTPSTRKGKAPKASATKISKSTSSATIEDPTKHEAISPQLASREQSAAFPKRKRQAEPKSRPVLATEAFPSPSLPSREGATGFLDIPAELRNEIYSYVLVDSANSDGFVPIRTDKPYVKEPALLAVNRQVRAEALGLFYGDSIFVTDGSFMVVRFLRSREDEQLRALRTIYIRTNIREAPKALIPRLQQLMRESRPRGFRRSVLHMMAENRDGVMWLNLPDLLRFEDEGTVKDDDQDTGADDHRPNIME